MEGKAQQLIQYFDGSDKRFIIPLYQRNYDWKEENCEQLFRDLMKLHKSGRESHFFGSIVSSSPQGSEDRYIIDGQQRITTISLLLAALVNAYKEGEIEATDKRLVEKIFKRYLVDEFEEDERKVKLKPIKKDMQAFDAVLFKDKSQYVKGSNVTRNYEFLYDKAVKSGLTLDELFDTIKRLKVINILLDEKDDAQLIFESLNSTGLDLSEADKIRNYLLMSLSPEEQDDLYSRYWNPIEEYTDYNPSAFVRDYLTMKQGRIGRTDKIYFIFKEYAESQSFDREKLMEDMHHYAVIYSHLNKAEIGTDKLNSKWRQLQTLDPAVAYPYFMALFDYARRTGLSEKEIYRILDVIESYWARRIICNLPSNALNKVFATLHREIMNLIKNSREGSSPLYFDVLVYSLSKRIGSAIFPSDEEVKENFATRQIYKMPPKARMFFLERMENRDSNERHDVVKELIESTITIEHIMPQKLSEKWKQELGNDWERIHQQYLHTMANLTLTGYNSQYSNLPFSEKREMKNGFKDSAFRLNNYLKLCEKWTEAELIERQKELFSVCIGLWRMPESDFMPKKREAETVSLEDEDFDYTNIKPLGFVLYGERYSAKDWADLFVGVCKCLVVKKHSFVKWMAEVGKNGLSTSAGEYKKEIGKNLYVFTNNNTNTKMTLLRGIFDECNIPASELIFELRSKNA